MALNARVRIVAGGVSQVEEIHSGGSYLSQNDTRVHFGLGTATAIDGIEVYWPSGKVERLGGIPADHFYCILEGHGLVTADKIRPTKPTR